MGNIHGGLIHIVCISWYNNYGKNTNLTHYFFAGGLFITFFGALAVAVLVILAGSSSITYPSVVTVLD